MDANQFPAALRQQAEKLETYVRDELPRIVVRKTLRYIEGNFRRQGWQGRTFLPWQKNKRGGTILVKTGKLRRSIHGEDSPFTARVYTNSAYARIHNRGFNGTVQVKAHTRYKYTATQVPTGRLTKAGTPRMKTMHQVASMTQVQAHQRQMKLPQRQFMPENLEDSPDLFNSIKKEVVNKIKTIFH